MTTPAIAIRPYEASDTDRLLAIWQAASLKGHPFFSADQIAQQRRQVAEIYLPKAETWVAVRSGGAVGFIGLIDGFIGGLFVDPSAHGQGIGRLLVDHAMKLRGALSLEVYALNTGALAFYRRLGFEEVDRRPFDDNGLPLELVELRSGGETEPA